MLSINVLDLEIMWIIFIIGKVFFKSALVLIIAYITVKFMDTNFPGLGKKHKVVDSWIRGFFLFSVYTSIEVSISLGT